MDDTKPFNFIKPVIQCEMPDVGVVSATLIRTISQFQTIHLKFQHPYGVVESDGKIFRGLIFFAAKYTSLINNPAFASAYKISAQ
jgi:hypothetical protein